jgi:hypothetical protein
VDIHQAGYHDAIRTGGVEHANRVRLGDALADGDDPRTRDTDIEALINVAAGIDDAARLDEQV